MAREQALKIQENFLSNFDVWRVREKHLRFVYQFRNFHRVRVTI